MYTVDTTQAIKDIRRSFYDLTNQEFAKGAYRAINHTLSKSQTFSNRQIRTMYSVSAKAVRERMSLSRAHAGRLQGMIIVKGKPLPLQEFKPRQTKEGVSILIKKGSRQLVRGAFLATMKSGHQGVFARGKYSGGTFQFRKERTRAAGGYKVVNGRWQPVNNDLAINELSTLSVPNAFMMPTVIEPTINNMEQEFQKRLVHDLTRIRG